MSATDSIMYVTASSGRPTQMNVLQKYKEKIVINRSFLFKWINANATLKLTVYQPDHTILSPFCSSESQILRLEYQGLATELSYS